MWLMKRTDDPFENFFTKLNQCAGAKRNIPLADLVPLFTEVFGEVREKFMKQHELIGILKTQIDELSVNNIRTSSEIKLVKSKTNELSNITDLMEQNDRKNIMILSGTSVPIEQPGENPTLQAKECIENKIPGLKVSTNDIEACYRIGKKTYPQNPNKPPRKILVKFTSPDKKTEYIKASKKVRPTGLFLSESLTETREKTLYLLRKIRKKMSNTGPFVGVTTIDGNIYVYLKTTNSERAQRTRVNCFGALSQLFKRVMKMDISEYIQDPLIEELKLEQSIL